MDIHVMKSTWREETPDLLPMILAYLPTMPDVLPYVYADAYGADGLVQILEVRALRGERGLVVWECSRDQVRAVLEWQSCDDEGRFTDLEIHLIRKNEEQKA